MKYILESNGVFVKSVSKDEITLTKKKEEAQVFKDWTDVNNHAYLLSLDYHLRFNLSPL